MAFDLDDDELKATRRMNGSDKNVACVEENIEGLKRLFYANALTQYGKRKFIGYYEQQIKELEENSIPVSLVEEKIEELKEKEQELSDEQGYWGSSDLLAKIEVLQDILGEE